MRDHGGNIDQAIAAHGGAMGDWVDLSTGINRVPYPLPPLPIALWQGLPTASAMDSLVAAARDCYGTSAAILPVAGAQSAIQMIPRLGTVGRARVLVPTYNEHAACLRGAGWAVEEVTTLEALAGADLAVVVNPNNPDGRCHAPDALLALASRVGRLVIDESFGDARADLTMAGHGGQKGLFILRSFGKFFGLAGVRLGFVLGNPDEIIALSAQSGPWPISGAAIEIGRRALADRVWAAATVARLRREGPRIDAMAARAGWSLVGGSELFRLYDTADARAAQAQLARGHVWSRIFPYSARWIRLGLPGSEAEWAQLEAALLA